LKYVYNNLVYDNRNNKGVLYRDNKILFMGNSWSGILQFLAYSNNAPEVQEMFKAQLAQREKPQFTSAHEKEK
jgi:hypothetical protein